MNSITDKQMGDTEKQFKRFEAMICSMTPDERSNPDLLAKARALRPSPSAYVHGQAPRRHDQVPMTRASDACDALHLVRDKVASKQR